MSIGASPAVQYWKEGDQWRCKVLATGVITDVAEADVPDHVLHPAHVRTWGG
jgi:hypothetical protein